MPKTPDCAGAAAAAAKGHSPTLKTIDGDQTYSTTQTIDNVHFTGNVRVTAGDVTFNFCSFTFQPPSASHSGKAQQLSQYNDGGPAGHLVCNWCDFDTGLPLTGGNFETCNFQAGQRVGKPTTGDSSFTLYRCRLQHCGNALGMHQFHTDKMSYVTECYFGDPTHGDRSHPDGFEIYSSDNLTVQRCRIMLTNRDQSGLNITDDFGDVPVGNPILINDNYISGGSSPVLALFQGGTVKKNVPLCRQLFQRRQPVGPRMRLRPHGCDLRPGLRQSPSRGHLLGEKQRLGARWRGRRQPRQSALGRCSRRPAS